LWSHFAIPAIQDTITFFKIIGRFDVSTLSSIWFDSRQFIIGSRKMNVNKGEDKGTLLSAKRIFHTMATAATTKEPEIEQAACYWG
jgi:hypothetical protein